MHVELLDYRSGVRQIMATIRMNDGQMVVEGKVPPNVQTEIDAAKQRAKSDNLFLQSLPLVFSGSYLRARLRRE